MFKALWTRESYLCVCVCCMQCLAKPMRRTSMSYHKNKQSGGLMARAVQNFGKWNLEKVTGFKDLLQNLNLTEVCKPFMGTESAQQTTHPLSLPPIDPGSPLPFVVVCNPLQNLQVVAIFRGNEMAHSHWVFRRQSTWACSSLPKSWLVSAGGEGRSHASPPFVQQWDYELLLWSCCCYYYSVL